MQIFKNNNTSKPKKLNSKTFNLQILYSARPSSVEHFIDSSIYANFQEKQQYLLAKKLNSSQFALL